MFFPENIPQELKDLPQWVVWRYEDKPNGEATKVPYYVAPGGERIRRASSTDRETWMTFSEALTGKEVARMAGVGFVFTAEDPYIGVDLDDCYDETRSPIPGPERLDPSEEAWVQAMSSYTEVSPSNTGVKVIVRGKLPADLDRHSWGGNGVYDRGRFFTVTGNVLSRNYSRIAPLPGDVLNGLLARWFPPVVTREWDEAEERLTDTEVIRVATRATNGEKFVDLWYGDWQEWFPSQSDADAGLIALLAFYTGPCPEQLDRLFRQSALMRDKWDERRGDGETYGSKTIYKVLSLMQEYADMTTRGVEVQGIVGPNPGDGTLTPPLIDPAVTLRFGDDAFGTSVKKRWAVGLDAYPSLDTRPHYLQLVYDHVAPLAQRLGGDWVDLMALSFLSSFFPAISIERLPLNLWVIGIGAQGVGKSVTSDELEGITRDTASVLACNLSTFSGGSNAGLIRLLAKDRHKKVLCYASEWTQLVGLMATEHSNSLREALLNYYDGRGYTHVLANEILEVESPYLVVNGVTTKANWQRATDYADTGNGFYSRFLFACPDIQPAGDEYPYRTRAQRKAVVDQLWPHIQAVTDRGLEALALEQRPSPAYKAYAKYLGMDNHSGFIDMDEVGLSLDDDDAQPAGRRLAQVKKLAGLLELLEREPQVQRGGYLVREANVQRAVQLVQRANAYSKRAYSWLARSKDEEQASIVLHTLEKGKDSEYGLMSRTGLGIVAVRAALELLEGEKLVASQVVEGKRIYAPGR